MKYIQNISLLLLLAAIAGCSTPPTRQTEIRENSIINKSTGFKGWTMKFPENYRNVDTEIKTLYSYGQVSWHLAQSIDKNAGRHTSEHHVFESDYAGVTVSTVQLAHMYDKSHITRLVEAATKGWAFPIGTNIERNVVTINGRKAAKISRRLNSGNQYNSVYQIPMPPSHLIVINTYCSSIAIEQLEADMEQIISNLAEGTNL